MHPSHPPRRPSPPALPPPQVWAQLSAQQQQVVLEQLITACQDLVRAATTAREARDGAA